MSTETRPDLWREPEALAYEGCAATLIEAVERINDAMEMLRFHGFEEAVTESRTLAARYRTIKGDLEGKAEALRAAAEAR